MVKLKDDVTYIGDKKGGIPHGKGKEIKFAIYTYKGSF